jgi:mannose-6-phosphate isomerase class I
MNKFILLFCAASFLMACNSETADTKTAGVDTTVSKSSVTMPYTMDKPSDWEKGDDAHAATAMNALKAFQENNMSAMLPLLADSVEFYEDNFNFKGPKDSLVKAFTTYRSTVDSIQIKMLDYESVKSQSRGEEWVSLWYLENTYPKTGKPDSLMLMDDIKIVNGKVAVIDSKMRHMPKRK